MVLRVESGDFIAPALTPLISGSLASGDDHVEGGYSSREDNDKDIAPKFVPTRVGRTAQRYSQCDHLGDFQKSTHFYHSGDRQQNSSSFKKYHIVALLAIIATLAGVCIYQRSQVFALRQELQMSNQHRVNVEKTRSEIVTQLANCEQSLEQYRHTYEQMQKVNQQMSEPLVQLRANYDQSVKELGRLQAVEKRVKFSEGRWDTYVERVRDVSKRSVMEKFGKGPHNVELLVQLPSSPMPEVIKIELAPLDMMPHSVHTFLEQVDQGAWNGAVFDAQAGHVLMARDSDVSKDDCSQEPPPTVLFPEFNAQYPHDKYTVAFPGHPSSSPDFYINLQSNSMHHSPRIDGDEYVEGEPCFGKIVDEGSRRVVDRMDGLSARDAAMGHDVVIKSARIFGR